MKKPIRFDKSSADELKEINGNISLLEGRLKDLSDPDDVKRCICTIRYLKSCLQRPFQYYDQWLKNQ